MEATGLVIGLAGLVAAFRGAIDGYLLVDAFLDNKTDSSYLIVHYHIQRTRLAIWGDYFQLNDASVPTDGELSDQSEHNKQLIIKILGEVQRIHGHVERLLKKHFSSDTTASNVMSVHDLRAGNQASKKLAEEAQRMKPHSKFKWIIKSESDFEKYVVQLKNLNEGLWAILPPSKVNFLHENLPSYAVLGLGDEQLKKLSDPRTESPLVMLAAKMKKLEMSAALTTKQSPTDISEKQLKLAPQASTSSIPGGLCELPPPHPRWVSVWVEWYTISRQLAEDNRHADRIRSLAFFLQQISEPAICLPPCLGICDDLAFEGLHGSKRLGCVFTVPRNDIEYEGDLRAFPPVTLSEHIVKTGRKPPLLGHRFALAYKLASAFGLFHSAGWLHKGFHSGNIVFLHKSNDAKDLTVDSPLITGFQFTRPQNEASLAHSPLESPELQYYYHPEAAKGFTKKLDLYSLGVVLCEIGRWGLVSDSTKKTLEDREQAREYILNKLIEDLGWRMGAHYQRAVSTLLRCDLPNDDDQGFFAQQYFEKILKRLDSCKA